jgi:hypothetical protein
MLQARRLEFRVYAALFSGLSDRGRQKTEPQTVKSGILAGDRNPAPGFVPSPFRAIHRHPHNCWQVTENRSARVPFLVPLQFSERLRRNYTMLHRAIGGVCVACVFVLGPIGVYIQFLDEGHGASRSFTIETVMQSGLLMVTTGIGLYFALKRMFTPHRQWMILSYAVALDHFAGIMICTAAVVLGLTSNGTVAAEKLVFASVASSKSAVIVKLLYAGTLTISKGKSAFEPAGTGTMSCANGSPQLLSSCRVIFPAVAICPAGRVI